MELLKQSTPELTLVVATLDRRDQLMELLQSIPDAHGSRVEILVIEQAGTQPSTGPAALLSQLPVTHIPVSFRNANAARNLGATMARGTWLMFPDDDARLLPTTLERALRLIRTDQFDLISGQIVDDANVPHLLRWLSHPAKITPQTIDHTLVESSFFIRRSLFLSVGGFDPLFGPGGPFPSAEGADMMHRIWRQASVRSHYGPEIAIYHPSKHAELTDAARQRIHAFAIGEGAFTVRHYRALPLVSIGRRLLFRAAGISICRGEKRRRKIAYLHGFIIGASRYWRLHRPTGQPILSPDRSATR